MINNLKDAQKNRLYKNKLSYGSKPQHYDMIVFSHIRWQFVYQRPQHIMSRMAKKMKILFIEEPLQYDENKDLGNLIIVDEKLHVLQPNVTEIESIAEIIPAYVKNETISFGWFYSAAFCPLMGFIDFDTVIYDCVEELSISKGTSADLLHQEKYLISQADIVFTAGKSLYESKKRFHNNVLCFPNSVDESHFSRALNGIAIPEDIAAVKSPIVGFYGVIDDRIDLQLLHDVAKKMPNISFVMIGPLTETAEANLPKEPNIHYLGMKYYNELPNYLKAFDIAMMPFKINESTHYLNPNKTLEYMAAAKPVISTRVNDVARDYSICVSLIDTADDFCESIKFLLEKRDRLSMEMEYYKILQDTSWNATVDKMDLTIKAFA
ncbi:glycosyltransferase [Flavobacterium sp. ARAG 55.4]|uniref:glycosyltransferase n=1 Tax=Flavobacterium sp. ARAG 55.4 TaxID=3451357 RepID=UPI003F46DFD2